MKKNSFYTKENFYRFTITCMTLWLIAPVQFFKNKLFLTALIIFILISILFYLPIKTMIKSMSIFIVLLLLYLQIIPSIYPLIAGILPFSITIITTFLYVIFLLILASTSLEFVLYIKRKITQFKH